MFICQHFACYSVFTGLGENDCICREKSSVKTFVAPDEGYISICSYKWPLVMSLGG